MSSSSVFVCILFCVCFFFFKQKTAYEMRISDWSSDVCSSDLAAKQCVARDDLAAAGQRMHARLRHQPAHLAGRHQIGALAGKADDFGIKAVTVGGVDLDACAARQATAELGRAPVVTPVTNAHLVCRILLDNKKLKKQPITQI